MTKLYRQMYLLLIVNYWNFVKEYNLTLQQVPVYVLPKVEYQACYGAEALTESELCRLWTESLLHSNSSFYVGKLYKSLYSPFLFSNKYILYSIINVCSILFVCSFLIVLTFLLKHHSLL